MQQRKSLALEMLRAELEQINVSGLDLESVKDALFRELALFDWAQIPENNAAEQCIMIDSVGNADTARHLFQLPRADNAELLAHAQEQLTNLLEELVLPGRMEYRFEVHADDVETLNLYYCVMPEDFPALEEKGLKLSTPPTFEEIVSSLHEKGHSDLARDLYETIWKGQSGEN